MEFLNKVSKNAHWLLRVAIFGVFIYHGLAKFPIAGNLANMMKMPVFMVYMLALMEVTAAVFIIIGGFGPEILTRISGAIVAIVMIGAIMMVHAKFGWNSVNMGSGNMGRGFEFQFTLLMIALSFLISGNRAIKIE